jgi:probable F420-dependent oxidoreductase
VRIGALLPQTEIGADPGALRAWAQAADELGYSHIAAYEHILGAERANRPAWWRGVYDITDAWHEIFVVYGYLAAVTRRLGFATSVLVLPLRPTALVAKQAAELDLLCGGKLRLGVGIGWNHVEFEALGVDFRDRARRMEEQIEVLRLLWTTERVDYTGRYHRIDRAGLRPLPRQRPIPIWIGADAEAAVKRAARVADGWFPYLQPDDEGRARLERFRGYAREAGRDPNSIGLEGRVAAAKRSVEEWVRLAEGFRGMGFGWLQFNTLRAGFTSVEQHIDALRRFREAATHLFD